MKQLLAVCGILAVTMSSFACTNKTQSNESGGASTDGTDYTSFCSAAVKVAETATELRSILAEDRSSFDGAKAGKKRLDAIESDVLGNPSLLEESIPGSLSSPYEVLTSADPDEIRISAQGEVADAADEIDTIAASECDLNFDLSDWIIKNS